MLRIRRESAYFFSYVMCERRKTESSHERILFLNWLWNPKKVNDPVKRQQKQKIFTFESTNWLVQKDHWVKSISRISNSHNYLEALSQWSVTLNKSNIRKVLQIKWKQKIWYALKFEKYRNRSSDQYVASYNRRKPK